MMIRLRSIVLQYDRGLPTATTALAGVDLDVGVGQSIAVIGPTGSLPVLGRISSLHCFFEIGLNSAFTMKYISLPFCGS